MTLTVVHLEFHQDPTSGFWTVTSPDLPDGSRLAAGDRDLGEARRLGREAVAFALGVEQVPDDVEIVEVMPGRRTAP